MRPFGATNRVPRRAMVAVLLALAIGCGGGGDRTPEPEGQSAAGAESPRVLVLLTIEGLGKLSLDATPQGEAPVLRGILSRAESVETLLTPSPILVPAVTSLMTGRTPREHGVLDNSGRRLAPEVPTLAEDFAASGFRTAAFVASPLVSWVSGLDRGFEVFDGARLVTFGPERDATKRRPAAEVAGNAVKWLESLPAGTRAFAWVHLSDVSEAPTSMDPAAVAAQRAGALAGVDSGIGRIRAVLSAGRLGPAILVVTSDRGSAPDLNVDLGQGFFLDPARIMVPMAVERIGGKRTAGDPTRPKDLVALASRLATLAGLDAPKVATPPLEVGSGPRIASVSAVPWIWARWEPAVAVQDGERFYIYDGAWRSVGAGGSLAVMREDDVPEAVRAMVQDTSRALVASLMSGPRTRAAEDLLARRGIRRGRDTDLPATPSLETRRKLVETLESARAALADGRSQEALSTLRRLAETKPPFGPALHDLGFIASMTPGDEETSLRIGKTLLSAFGAVPVALHPAAHAALAKQDWDLAEPLLMAVLEQTPDQPDVLYDVACVKSLRQEVAASAEFLERALVAGFAQFTWLEQDPDLRNLRADPRFAEVMRKHGR